MQTITLFSFWDFYIWQSHEPLKRVISRPMHWMVIKLDLLDFHFTEKSAPSLHARAMRSCYAMSNAGQWVTYVKDVRGSPRSASEYTKNNSLSTLISSTLHKKWSFPLRISSVNVTKSAGNSGYGHIYWRNP